MTRMNYISAYPDNGEVHVWEKTEDGGRQLVRYPTPYYFYVPDPNGKYTSVYGDKLRKETFLDRKEMEQRATFFKARGTMLHESDISGTLKVLTNNYYNVDAPKLNYCLLDIEVDYSLEKGHASVENPYAPINAIAMCHYWKNEKVVIAVPPPTYADNKESWDSQIDEIRKNTPNLTLYIVNTERELLQIMIEELQPADVVSGWNSDWFDIPYIVKRLQLVLGQKYADMMSFPGAPAPRTREAMVFGKIRETVDLGGRISWDYMELFKKFEMSQRPSYSLEAISTELLPDLPKLEYEGTLYTLYRDDFPHFIRYNIRDTDVLEGFEKKLGYLEVANLLYHMSCGQANNIFGTIKLADLAIINYCHYVLKRIVPDRDESKPDGVISGAMVLHPQMGLHDWLASVDVTSLYPSSIRAVNISPDTLIGQMRGLLTDDERMKHSAWVAIFERSNAEVTLDYDPLNPEKRYGSETHTGAKWADILIERGWAVSGYGTIYTQNFDGFIPAILTDWFAQRKKYKKMMGDAKNQSLAVKDDPEEYARLCQLVEYYDRLQYIFKIKLNSLYGALTNYNFRFFDLRLGESTTATGRCVLDHMCSQIALMLDKQYSFVSDSIIYGDSVAGDTKIRLESGDIVNIESLFTSVDYRIGTKEYCNTNNVCALTYDETVNESCYKPIKYVMRHKINKKMFRVWTTNTTYVDVTEDHSLIGYANTRERKRNNNSPLIEVKPDNLGNIKSLIYLKRVPRNIISSKNFNIHVYELMGLIIGNGSMSTRTSGIELSLGCSDKDEIISKTIQPLIGAGLVTSVYHLSNTHNVRVCGTKIWDLIYDELYVNGVKTIPSWIQRETDENISAFLRGYFTADGTVTGNTVRLTSANLSYIEAVQEMLFKLGISSNYFVETAEHSFKGKFSGTHSINLTVKGGDVFCSIGFLLDQKNAKIPKNGKLVNYQSRYDFSTTRVVKVEEIDYDGYVYDIEVGDTHVFFANNVLVHNTDSCYFKTHAGIGQEGKTSDEIRERATLIGDHLGTAVNDSFPAFCIKAFRVKERFSNMIKCEREVIGKRGIFVTKKRYVIKVVNLDGFVTNKLKAMGLEMKKTTTPKTIQEFTKEVVDMILDGVVSWDDIDDYIIDFRSKFHNDINPFDLGLPKGVKNVEEYTRKLEINEKIGEPTRLPGHVAASIHYNRALLQFNDKESLPIISGTKIRLFYLKRPRGRFKSIAIPTDEGKFPSWMLNDPEFEVNMKLHEEKLIDDILSKIFTVLNRTVPTAQSKFNYSLMEW